MQPAQILTADLLDILFEGKNKEYGAYQLRKQYNKRLNIAMLSTLLFISVPILIYSFSEEKNIVICEFLIPPIELAPAPIVEIQPDPPPPASQAAKPVKTIKSVNSITIVPDNNIKEDDKVPIQDELDNAKIGTLYRDGDLDLGIAPPQNGTSTGHGDNAENMRGTGLANNSSDFIPIEIESEYPGGKKAWQRFLNKTLSNYPDEAYEKGIQGTVIIQFVVDIDGSVSNIQAISGPEELKEVAINTIKKSGKWKPAVQNGRNVKSFKKQPITFVLNVE